MTKEGHKLWSTFITLVVTIIWSIGDNIRKKLEKLAKITSNEYVNF